MISIVLPVYNEEKDLRKNVERIIAQLKKLKDKYEIIIAEDGSTDKTYEIGLDLSKKYKKVRVVHSKERLGRGLALKRAFKSAGGDYVGYMDIDLATDLGYLKNLVRYVREYDVVTGSRYLKESKIKRTRKRIFLSRLYNFLARLLFNSKIHDHQCGFKAFKKSVVLKLNEMSKSDYWFWDTEILILAQRYGYTVKEFPVEWKEGKETKVNALKDALNMLFNLIILRLNMV